MIATFFMVLSYHTLPEKPICVHGMLTEKMRSCCSLHILLPHLSDMLDPSQEERRQAHRNLFAMNTAIGLLPCPWLVRTAGKQAAYQFSARLPAHEEQYGGHHSERAGSPSLLSGAFFGIIWV